MNQIRIVMTGQLNTPPYQQVTWQVFNQPDNTGVLSGYPVGTLINIQADYLIDPAQTINPISLAVGGDLSGSLPNPSVSGLQGNPVGTGTPATGQILTWNGTSWRAATPPSFVFAYGRITNPEPGSPSLVAGLNVAAVSGGGVTPGVLRVTFTTAASSANYIVTATAYPILTSPSIQNIVYCDTFTTGGFYLYVFDLSDGSYTNNVDVGFSILGG